MNIYKRIFAAFFCLLLIVGTIAAYAQVSLADTGIYDPSGKVSDEAVLYITNRNNSLYSKTGAKVLIALIPTSGGNSLADYANNMFARENIDYYGKKNSVLIVISCDEKDYWARSAVAVSQSLTDEVLGGYLVDAFEPYFAEDKFSEGVINLYDAVSGWYMDHYELLDLNDVLATDEQTDNETSSPVLLEIIEKVLFIIVLLLIFGVILLYLIKYFIKSELKKRRQRPSNLIDHTNIDEIIDELPDKPKSDKKGIRIKKLVFKKHKLPEDVVEPEIVPDEEPEIEPSNSYVFTSGIDIEKEFADIDIDAIINKNTENSSDK